MHLHTRFLCEFVPTTMSRFGMVPVCTFMLKILGFISRYICSSKLWHVVEENGSNFCGNHSNKEDQVVSKICTVVLSSEFIEKESLELQRGKGSCGNIADTEGSVYCPKSVKFIVQETFVGSDESRNQSLDCEISTRKDPLEQKLVGSSLEFDEIYDSSSFGFELLFNSCCSTNEDTGGLRTSELEIIAGEKADNVFKSPCTEEIHAENENLNSADPENFRVDRIGSVEYEVLEDQDFSYGVKLLPQSQFLAPNVNQESVAAEDDILISEKIESSDDAFLEGIDSKTWKKDSFEATDQWKPKDIKEECNTDHRRLTIRNSVLTTERAEDLDDKYIKLERLSVNLTDTSKEIFCCGDASKAEKLHEPESTNIERMLSFNGLQEHKDSWDSESDDEYESDVLWEHQHLVQQMKTELKNCKIRGLPTISEESETPKMADDLKPLEIDQKFEYKDMIEEIQKFNKIYREKMRKLDILNYQTLHAISFLQMKDSKLFTASKKKVSAPFGLLKIWPCKVETIYADQIHKSIKELHRDLELVYVGQLCLSWEILSWLYVKALELMDYDSKGRHSYNRVAEDFQQFQVLVQRFMEDEPFQGPRILNYVKKRCIIRSLLQVPTIKDDCSKDKKERREESDTISLQMLVQIIRESMLIFWEFLRADKGSTTNVVLSGFLGTKVDLQETAKSGLLVNIITDLHKKDRRIREQIRSQDCIVKKLQKHQERRSNDELLTSQVELRLVSRVLSLSRLTTDQLKWCQNKLSNISFVSRRVHMEPSFLLFPC